MGCACSSDKKYLEEYQKDAEGAYEAAENGVAKALEATVGVADVSLSKVQRIQKLEEIFDACDDDKSGALSMAEYAQLFDNQVSEEIRTRYNLIDGIQKDGKLSKTEFVAYHAEKFSSLDDDAFIVITGRLLTKAEDVVVLDEEPATVDVGYSLPKWLASVMA